MGTDEHWHASQEYRDERLVQHFNENRELVDGPPCEFWDDIEYQPSMDKALHYLMNPDKSDFPDAARRERKWWYDSQGRTDPGSEV